MMFNVFHFDISNTEKVHLSVLFWHIQVRNLLADDQTKFLRETIQNYYYSIKVDIISLFFIFFLFYSTILSRYNLNSIPFSILFQYTVTYLSLSRRDCSWKKPSACINSCIAVPFRSQPFPKDNRCLPPLRPIEDQQLWVNKQIMSNSDWRKLWAEGSISWGLLVPISYYPTTANLF